jgi:hypothetical protein
LSKLVVTVDGVATNRTTADGTFTLSLLVTNTGEVDSAVPIQVFFRDPVCYPVRIASIQLVRFTKVFLKAKEAKAVTIELAASDLRYYDDGRNSNDEVGNEGGWVVDKGVFNLIMYVQHFPSRFQCYSEKSNKKLLLTAGRADSRAGRIRWGSREISRWSERSPVESPVLKYECMLRKHGIVVRVLVLISRVKDHITPYGIFDGFWLPR